MREKKEVGTGEQLEPRHPGAPTVELDGSVSRAHPPIHRRREEGTGREQQDNNDAKH